MDEKNIIGLHEYESIQHPLYEHYDDRVITDKDMEWIVSKTDGYDFKGLKEIGYIYHWDTRKGRKEYILRVPIERFIDLFNDYLHGEGRQAMIDYEEWEYKDGIYIWSRRVD